MGPAEIKSDSTYQAGRFAAFISYAHADDRAARWLHHALETYRIPAVIRRRDGHQPRLGRLFLDRSELPTAADLASVIQDALTRSDNLIVICSPRSAASRWVNQEIEFFRSLGRGDRIFCLIVDGEPGTEATTPFPSALTAGSSNSVEPLAADIRPGKDGRTDAKLKIIAGLLDVGFDDLRQREASRRQRRFVVAISAGLLLMLAMLVLTVNAMIARRDADRQRQTAERTTGFLTSLFEDSDPNETRGKEVTARQILDRGATKLSGSADLADQPEVRAGLLITLAEVYSKLGLYRQAVGLIGQAGDISGRAKIDQARSARLLGEIATINSDYDRAKGFLERALILAGDDSKLRLSVLVNLGELYKSTGRYDEAETALNEAMKIARSMSPSDDDNATSALASLGGADFEAGKYDRAVKRLKQVVADRTRLSGPLHPEVAFALNTLGTVAIKQGDRADATRYFKEALARQIRILGPNHLTVAITKANLARAMVEDSQFATAAAMAEQAISVVLQDNDGSLDSLANMYDTLGLAKGALGQVSDARLALSKSIRIGHMHEMAKEGEALGDLAELECTSGNVRDGYAKLAEARAAYLRTDATENWRGARLNAVQAQCQYRSGSRSEAKRLAQKNRPAIVTRWGEGSLFDVRIKSIADGSPTPAQ